jgi:hypothetical protein
MQRQSQPEAMIETTYKKDNEKAKIKEKTFPSNEKSQF